MFKNTIARLTIGSLDDTSLFVEASYNPKELQRQRTIDWKSQTVQSDDDEIEFTGAQPRTMDLEMLFDGYEAATSVDGQLEVLERLATARKPGSKIESERRPHYCVVTWGKEGGMNPMRCVITSLTTKVTMFDTKGTPLRAMATIKVQEARIELADADRRVARTLDDVQDRMDARAR